MQFFPIYLAAISALSIVVTIQDKRSAQKHRWRVPEATLFLLAALGGSAAMLLTMRIIHHKTLHKRFMLGLPLILAVQAALFYVLYNHHLLY